MEDSPVMAYRRLYTVLPGTILFYSRSTTVPAHCLLSGKVLENLMEHATSPHFRVEVLPPPVEGVAGEEDIVFPREIVCYKEK